VKTKVGKLLKKVKKSRSQTHVS